jgi:hypothetical protein
MYYIGLDVHKRMISYCLKDNSGQIHSEGKIPATRYDLDRWMKTLPQPWSAVMEATMFTGWIYDHLKPHAAALKVAHPLMLRAVAAACSHRTGACRHRTCQRYPASTERRSRNPAASRLALSDDRRPPCRRKRLGLPK